MKEFINKIKPKALWFFQSFIWLGLLFLIIDIVSKSLVIANREYILAQEGGQGIVLIPGFLAINYVINTGAAFGLSAGDTDAGYLANRIIYIVIATLAIAGLLFLYIKKYKNLSKYYRACIMLIICGALGNLIDRVAYTPAYLGAEHNGVVDWINFFGVWAYNFNIADSVLVIAVIMVIVMLIVEEVRDHKKKNAEFKKYSEAKQEAKVEEAKPVEDKVEEKPVEEAKPEPNKAPVKKAPAKKKNNKK